MRADRRIYYFWRCTTFILTSRSCGRVRQSSKKHGIRMTKWIWIQSRQITFRKFVSGSTWSTKMFVWLFHNKFVRQNLSGVSSFHIKSNVKFKASKLNIHNSQRLQNSIGLLDATAVANISQRFHCSSNFSFARAEEPACIKICQTLQKLTSKTIEFLCLQTKREVAHCKYQRKPILELRWPVG